MVDSRDVRRAKLRRFTWDAVLVILWFVLVATWLALGDSR